MKKKRILILGAEGMLGSTVYNFLKKNTEHVVLGTTRGNSNNLECFDANNFKLEWDKIFNKTKPNLVVNCIGLLKNYPDKRKITTREYKKINSEFPKQLDRRATENNFRLIHISTDGVFSEKQRKVFENSFPKPNDIYGQSKLEGEVKGKNSLTIRTSIIGLDPKEKKGLIEWVAGSKGNINGFTNHKWSGATTLQVAELINWLIIRKNYESIKSKTNILHYSPLGPTSKYELLKIISAIENPSINIRKTKAERIVSRYLKSKYSMHLPKQLFDNRMKPNLTRLRNSAPKRSDTMKRKKKLAFVLGIRPDIIRAALIMIHLKKAKDIEVIFIWSGQHYDHNLKGIFFEELNMPKPDYDLQCGGSTDAEISGQLIKKLYVLLEGLKPDAVAFLGDTNTTTGCIAVAQLNIPLIHVEGCWHSYDWRMPEEKFRTMIDHLSDVVYTYEEEYKLRGIAEGLNPRNIVVVRNPIVDILNTFYYKNKKRLEKMASKKFFTDRGIKDKKYYLLTWHRRENVHIKKSFISIMKLIGYIDEPVYFPASYRTQGVIKEMNYPVPENLIITDPIGYEEILILMTHSKGVLTDSGTIVEETSVLNIPTVQIRKSTERPQVYDVGGCVKFDPDQPEKYTPEIIMKKLKKISNKKWEHTLGDGKSSERIANDLIRRLRENDLRGHLPEHSHLPINRSFREDDIKVE